MFQSLEKFHEVSHDDLIRVFESFKANRYPEGVLDEYFDDFIGELEVFLRCCKRISNGWKKGIPYPIEDRALFDKFINTFESSVSNPTLNLFRG